MIQTVRRTLTLGTRGSALARWQTDWVQTRLSAAYPDLPTLVRLFTTSGDRIIDKPLPEIGGKGLFTEELEDALRSGEIDLAVHSLKDLPVEPAAGLTLAAICPREDARDVLVSASGRPLADLPAGAQLGTSSLRRSAQVLARRPDFKILPLRGNVDTRLRKAQAGEYDAIILAAAGVLRLGLGRHITEYLPFETMLPAPGQGAMAVQCRTDDSQLHDLLGALDDAGTRAAVMAERAFLAGLGGGCSAPVAAYAHCPHSNGVLHLEGLIAAPDGSRTLRRSIEGGDPLAAGQRLAQDILGQAGPELLEHLRP